MATYRRLGIPAGRPGRRRHRPRGRAALAECRSLMGWLLNRIRARPPLPSRLIAWRGRPGGVGRRLGATNKDQRDLATTIAASACCWRIRASRRRPKAEYRKALAIQPEAGRRQPRRHRLPSSTWRISHGNLGQVLQQTGRPSEGRGRVPQGAGRSRRSSPPTTPPSAASEAAWRQATNSSAGCAASGKACGGRSRVPRGDGDLPEAGRRQSRRLRIPHQSWRYP